MKLKWTVRRGRTGRRRPWILLLVTVVVIAGIAAVLSIRPAEVAPVARIPVSSVPAAVASPTATTTAVEPSTMTSSPPDQSAVPAGEPSILDYRLLANIAARTIYTWDTRTATYSETYGRLRSWWHVLPDGSNPLTIFAQQFEATGTNAAAFASLTGAKGYRTAQTVNSSCDEQLAQYVQQPPPWVGLHVCTVTLSVVEHATSGVNKYTAPISIVVNCPPAVSAPADRCDMVAFYAAPERIVY
ncbi:MULTISPECIES: hypothetical protein [Micrococcaceae]|uniref:hypothetical protein n=1 Tax=Micrococcaceae TaxID=1268 RepID=UPI000CE39413|nr:hypothetical protein [Arthrobacter sp. N199823]